MRCKTCDYPLWNLPTRQCPECGNAFLPSEFAFRPSTVEFCCPHCQQSYYGTDVSGHLVPRAFSCVKCSAAIEMDAMLLRPAGGASDATTEADFMPWLERHRRGRIRSWFRMVGRGLVSPGKLMDVTPVSSSTGDAVWFAVINAVVIAGAFFLPFGLCVFLPMLFGGPGGGGGGGMITGPLILMACSAGFILFGLLIWGITAHGLLRLTGATQHTVGRTYQAVCYTSGAMVTSATPCVGFYFGWIWWTVSAIIGVQKAQNVSGGRATFAVLTPPLLAVAGGFVWLLFAIASVNQNLATLPRGAGARGVAVAQANLAAAYSAYEWEMGTYPTHPLELVLSGRVVPPSLVTTSGLDTVAISGGTLADWWSMSLPQRQGAVRTAVNNVNASVVAFRFGDYVYMTPGLAPSSLGDLWVFVGTPDGAVYGVVEALRVDGSSERMNVFSLPSNVEVQNELRAGAGLSPLPVDLSTITPEQPWLKQDGDAD
ncbi:MAG: hypothetical protein ACR2GY_03010 [Phycisphaerales bacterium]